MHRIINVVTYIGMFIVIGVAILTGLDVLGRYFFQSPVKGTYELTEILLSSIVAFGIAAATAVEEHIKVDALLVNLPPSGQRMLKLTANSVAILVFAVLIWQGIVSGAGSIAADERTEVLGVPVYPFRFVLVLGFLLSFIVLLYKTVCSLSSKTD